jgi:hypothetical protein
MHVSRNVISVNYRDLNFLRKAMNSRENPSVRTPVRQQNFDRCIYERWHPAQSRLLEYARIQLKQDRSCVSILLTVSEGAIGKQKICIFCWTQDSIARHRRQSVRVQSVKLKIFDVPNLLADHFSGVPTS